MTAAALAGDAVGLDGWVSSFGNSNFSFLVLVGGDLMSPASAAPLFEPERI
jgi:hypothetical protein